MINECHTVIYHFFQAKLCLGAKGRNISLCFSYGLCLSKRLGRKENLDYLCPEL